MRKFQNKCWKFFIFCVGSGENNKYYKLFKLYKLLLYFGSPDAKKFNKVIAQLKEKIAEFKNFQRFGRCFFRNLVINRIIIKNSIEQILKGRYLRAEPTDTAFYDFPINFLFEPRFFLYMRGRPTDLPLRHMGSGWISERRRKFHF